MEQVADRQCAEAFLLLELDFELRASSVKMSAGSLIQPCSKNSVICFSPSPSISKARRETKCLRCSTFCDGQANSPVQRVTAPSSPLAVVSRITAVRRGHGQWVGNL